jgi:hypothetical protein
MGREETVGYFAVANVQQSGRLSCLSGLSLYFSAPIAAGGFLSLSWRVP